jgi:DNA polymerase-4/DNA polymerase V
VSIGVSVTKTLAKIASDVRKPDGTTAVPGRGILPFLDGIKVRNIPGIGANREALLNKFKIFTAAQYAQADAALIRRLLGKAGVDLWHELRGTPLSPLELVPKLPKSVARTASLGQVTQDRNLIAAHLSHHTTRMAVELVTKRHLARRLTVFLTLKSFASKAVETRFDDPTANVFAFSRAVRESLAQLYSPGEDYRGCGVIAAEISPAAERSLDLFGEVLRDNRKENLMDAVDALNRRYGNHTVAMLAAMPAMKRKTKPRFRLPMFEAE